MPGPAPVIEKLKEELDEVQAEFDALAIAPHSVEVRDRLEDELGDLLLKQQQQGAGVLHRQAQAAGTAAVVTRRAWQHQGVQADLDQTTIVPEGLQALHFNVIGFSAGKTHITTT